VRFFNPRAPILTLAGAALGATAPPVSKSFRYFPVLFLTINNFSDTLCIYE
jgi:hypothetical protein